MSSFWDRQEARFRTAWERTDNLFGLLKPEALFARPIILRHPFIFYLGHLPAFAWNQACRGLLGYSSFKNGFDDIFSRGIDPDVDTGTCHSHPDIPQSWPDLAEVVDYRDRVRAALFESLDFARSDRVKGSSGQHQIFSLVLEHELMHQETLLYMMQELPLELKIRPGQLPECSPRRGEVMNDVRIPAGRAILGAAAGSIEFGWDNEFQEQTAEVPAFRMASTPITNGQFFDFLDSGSYEEARHWSKDDWAWKVEEEMHHPRFWICRDGQWFYRTLFDVLPLSAVLDWPVYVSLAEARAYARWKGKRIPTEAEFHRAAFYDPSRGQISFPWGEDEPSAEHGNFGFSRWFPAPVGSNPKGVSPWGVHELIGNGWEWTETPFRPFAGFVPMQSYPEYSADFFDGKH
ncbi:MAG TPA: SUMF1/EgtB/PvdO family nonheme iron enzyme, partial [Candidatus Binatia bacterium]|nr:SUMF1/EgtB/PvdO family nonheme iron enzyme [Candidatus Binatia bacterium]